MGTYKFTVDVNETEIRVWDGVEEVEYRPWELFRTTDDPEDFRERLWRRFVQMGWECCVVSYKEVS